MCCHGVSPNRPAQQRPSQDITAPGGPENARNNPRAQVSGVNNPMNPMNAPDSFSGSRTHKSKHHHKKHKHHHGAGDPNRVAALKQTFQGLVDKVRKMLPQTPATSVPSQPAAPTIAPPAQHAPV